MLFFLTSCETSDTIESSESIATSMESSSSGTEDGEDKAKDTQIALDSDTDSPSDEETDTFNIENLTVVILGRKMNSAEMLEDNILCVLSDGQVWNAVYSYSEKGADISVYIDKFYDRDESVVSLFSDLEYIGRLETEEIELLAECIPNINLDSEFFQRDEQPEMIDDICYLVYCYVPLQDGTERFYIASYGNATGTDYVTKDDNAISIREMIQNSTPYNIWMKDINAWIDETQLGY